MVVCSNCRSDKGPRVTKLWAERPYKIARKNSRSGPDGISLFVNEDLCVACHNQLMMEVTRAVRKWRDETCQN